VRGFASRASGDRIFALARSPHPNPPPRVLVGGGEESGSITSPASLALSFLSHLFSSPHLSTRSLVRLRPDLLRSAPVSGQSR